MEKALFRTVLQDVTGAHPLLRNAVRRDGGGLAVSLGGQFLSGGHN